MDMEVCTTLGMLTPEQAQQLKKAGLTAYNHNLDTSREYYPKVTSSEQWDEPNKDADLFDSTGRHHEEIRRASGDY